jgi:lipopolysaccharide transport system permease protein
VFTVIFGRLAQMPSDGQPYALFALAALAPWTYFSTAVTAGAHSLVGSEHLISKVYFVWFGVMPGPALLLLPLVLVLAVATALAASLWLSALNVLYRDVRFVLPFVLQFWMFVTPVVYPASQVPEQWRPVYGLNPMATVVEGFRATVLGTSLPLPMMLASVAAAAAALAGGVVFFRRMEGRFADVL